MTQRSVLFCRHSFTLHLGHLGKTGKTANQSTLSLSLLRGQIFEDLSAHGKISVVPHKPSHNVDVPTKKLYKLSKVLHCGSVSRGALLLSPKSLWPKHKSMYTEQHCITKVLLFLQLLNKGGTINMRE